MTPLLRKATDDGAFERLYRKHVKDVFRYSLAVLGEPADAEDVTQTTFLNAYRAFQRGERPEKPQNWLIAIAHNVCRQRFRQQQRRPREVELADELGGAIEHEQEEGPSVEELRRAFAALPSNQRAALVMRELEGRSYAEISEVLGISVSALETLLFRARRALREQLEEQLSCRDAAFAISKQLDGRLPAAERRALRAHLRACTECAALAHSQRAQRRALRALLAVPLPPSLETLAWHGSEVASTAAAAGGAGAAVKAAALFASASLVGGGTYAGVKEVPKLVEPHPARTAHVRPAPRRPAAVAAVATTAVAVRPVAAAAAAKPKPKPSSRPKPQLVGHRPPHPTPPPHAARRVPAVAAPAATPEPAAAPPPVHVGPARAGHPLPARAHRAHAAPPKAKHPYPHPQPPAHGAQTPPGPKAAHPRPPRTHTPSAHGGPKSHSGGRGASSETVPTETAPTDTAPTTTTAPPPDLPLPDAGGTVTPPAQPQVPPPLR